MVEATTTKMFVDASIHFFCTQCRVRYLFTISDVRFANQYSFPFSNGPFGTDRCVSVTFILQFCCQMVAINEILSIDISAIGFFGKMLGE